MLWLLGVRDSNQSEPLAVLEAVKAFGDELTSRPTLLLSDNIHTVTCFARGHAYSAVANRAVLEVFTIAADLGELCEPIQPARTQYQSLISI